jgi:CarD family transcriptional regulator
MFEIGNLVMYGIHGVCKIVDKELRTIDRKKMEYLVLEPVNQNSSRFYVPSGNPNAMAKLRRLMTRQELETLLVSGDIRQPCWIEDENLRKQHYRDLVSTGDRVALLRMLYTLYRHRESQLSSGRKFHLCDENFLRDAQRLIETEFAAVLQIPTTEVHAYVMEKLSA